MGIGSIFALPFKGKANRLNKEARGIDRISILVRNLQRRRSFIRAARQAQAQALVGGVATGAGLDSSGVQGNLASLRTQEQFGVFESRELQRFGLKTSQKRDEAGRALEMAAGVEGSVDAFAQMVAGG